LKNVKAATLLIVGARDSKEMISLNKKALQHLKNAKDKDLVIVPKAGHLYNEEEEGTMEKVAHMSKEWFEKSRLNKIL
jgi:pimeloyl-ACP methyl ester carboxylesterase